MPELPEVETIVRDLRNKVLERTFVDVWTDFEKMFKRPENFQRFKKELEGKKILNVWRRGKNIIFGLSEGYSLLIHQKLTGHILYGTWNLEYGVWASRKKGPLSERVNAYIHLLLKLDDGKMLALSDLRKFAKVELWRTEELKQSKEFKELGPEPLGKDFTFKEFGKRLAEKKGKIKQVLMNQKIITGIGNIYSDEILFTSKVHPLERADNLSEKELKKVYRAIKKILSKAIDLRGESFSNYRDIEGRRGQFDKTRKVYRKEGEKCNRCGAIIQRIKISGRSAHFCPICQNLEHGPMAGRPK
ncbi:DNA-formamidopyrimidine glycosylase [Patescibacteria group bacterium]|nr:DNA-formamidopyrimidine glycosylase [Patescibacteria group bacterium]